MIGCITPFMTPLSQPGFGCTRWWLSAPAGKDFITSQYEWQNCSQQILPPSDSKSNLGMQIPDISELSHAGLQCIRPHSDHSCDLDDLEKGF